MSLLDSVVGLDPFFADLDRLSRHVLTPEVARATLPMDVLRRGDELLISVDVPGVAPEAIDVTVQGHTLTITAERSATAEQGDTVYLRGRSHGTAKRQLTLPDALDVTRLEASYDAGVLTIRVPTAESARPRRISVNTGGAEQREIPAG